MPEQRGKTVLSLNKISKVYPGTVALHDVSLNIEQGEVHGIIGKNGAGKTTLVAIIAGIIAPTEGAIDIADHRYKSLTCAMARREAIAIVPQEPQLLMDLSVAENLFIPNYHLAFPSKLIHWEKMYQKAAEILTSSGLTINPRAKAGELSISDRQLILVVKACFVEKARIIILDEVSASLTQKDEKLLYSIIAERKKEGKTILFISHRIDELLNICDRVTVLRDGHSVNTVSCSELDPMKLSSLIIGEKPQPQHADHAETTDNNDDNAMSSSNSILNENILEVENFTCVGSFNNISFTLKNNEILGLAGLRGSGRTEIFRSMLGIDPFDEGRILLKGKPVSFASPADALKNGVAFLPEDRENEGIVSSLTVRENLILSALSRITRFFYLHKQSEKDIVNRLVQTLDIKLSSPEQEVSQLSGGNKQKVVIGRIIANQPSVYILDEPTRGIDIAAKESVLAIIKEQLSRTAGVIITSPGLDDLLKICHRILVLHRGRITAEFSRDDFEEAALYNAIQGVAEKK